MADDDLNFSPDNDKLVHRYLRAKLDGTLSAHPHSCFFHDADVCSARPEELVRGRMAARVPKKDAGDGQQWYFFSPVRFLHGSDKKMSRTIAGTDEKESWHAEKSQQPVKGGGYVRRLSYQVKAGKDVVEKPGWILFEYTLEKTENTRDGDTSLCKVYRSPRGPGRTKRKAADVLQEEATPNTRPRRQIEEAPLPAVQDDQAVAPMFSDRGMSLGYKIVAAHEVEESQQVPHDLEQDNGVSTEHHAAVPEVADMVQVEETQPDPLPTSSVFADFTSRLMADEEDDGMQIPDGVDSEEYYARNWAVFDHNDKQQQQQQVAVEESRPMSVPQITQTGDAKLDDGMTLEVPDGEEPHAYYDEQQDAAVQTAYGPMSDGDVILALAAGVTVDELLPDNPSFTLCA